MNHPPAVSSSGWQRGPDTTCHDCHGRTSHYTTVEPCTHHWTNDDPTPDELISLDEYLHRHPEDTHLFNRWPQP